MALLGLVRLLHPGGPAILSIRPRGRSLRLPLEARKRAECPAGHMARRRPADDRSAPEWVSNVHGGPRHARCPAPDAGHPARRTGSLTGFARILQGGMCESSCDAILAGAILCGPSAPETFAGDASRPRGGGGRQRSSGIVGWMSIGRSSALAPRPRPWPAAPSNPVNPERRSYRTNGRQAGLASCPG